MSLAIDYVHCHGCGDTRRGKVVKRHPDGPLFGYVCFCDDCRPDRVAYEAERAAWWLRWGAGAKPENERIRALMAVAS